MTSGFRGESGLFFVPMAMLLAATSAGGFGSWLIMRQWRVHAATQLRLDRCIADAAKELRPKLEKLDFANHRISEVRAAILAATLSGKAPLIPPLKAVLSGLVAFQETVIGGWEIRRLGWVVKRGCDLQADWPLPLPSIACTRPPPDGVGPRPLACPEHETRSGYFLQLSHSPRHSAAVIRKKEGSNGSWTAEFQKPRPLSGWTGLH